MELFISNIPAQSTENSLRAFFKPHLQALSIRSVHCAKHQDKRFGNLNFLHIDEAELFLRTYGQPQTFVNRRTTRANQGSRQGPRAPLLIFHGFPLNVRRSERDANPQLIRVLEKEEKDRTARQLLPMTTEHPRAGSSFPVFFDTYSVSCGVWSYAGSNAVFEPQLTWTVDGTAKFGEHSMILSLRSGKRIDFLYFGTLCIITDEGKIPSFILSMRDPPRFYEDISNQSIVDLLEQLNIHSQPIVQQRKNGPQRHRIPCLDSEHQLIAGSCLVYRVALKGETTVGARGNTLSDRIQSLRKSHGMPRMLHRHTYVQLPHEKFIDGFRALIAEISRIESDLPFELTFQIQKLAQGGYLPPRAVLRLLPEIKALLQRNSLRVCVHAVKRLFQQISFPGPETESTELEHQTIIDFLKKNEEQCNRNENLDGVQTSSNLAIIHRAKVTPTGILLGGPEAESNNRVLRKYPDHHEYFIRVMFCDEDGLPVRFNPRVSNEKIFHGRFKGVLQNGIDIAGRSYEFLGFSHSSLRSQSCWFMTSFVYNDTLHIDRMIIRQLGDFEKIQSPAKCAARIGQVFSDTRIAVPIENEAQYTIPDIDIDGRVFSDGVGTMSRSVMLKIWDALPRNRLVKPTHFQIRYQGAKGMISLDTRLQGDVLNLRPSMIKFDGSTWPDIEICDASYKPLQVFLNRQFIKILEDMGVEDEYFLNLQEKEVDRLRSITANPLNASTFLKRQSIGEPIYLSWFINELAALDIDFRKDGFLRDVLEMALLNELRLLKHKTRIPVEKGWHLHGLMDETGFLEEGQVFVAASENGISKAITGPRLIVTRAPALHPGDIQIVQGVMPPSGSPLRELTNCICFSSKGSRDLPSQLSGGDLDGDRYYVIWDEDCSPKVTFTPADYPRLPPINIGRTVTRSDMTDFFIQFMETDQLGRIAVLHRVLADQYPEGTRHSDCVKLAEMHSTAVDFSKTGIPVDMLQLPKHNRFRPDFEAPGPHIKIEKHIGIILEDDDNREPDEIPDDDDGFSSYRYYESEKVLGKLYRAIDERAIFDHNKQRALALGVTTTSTIINLVWAYVQNKSAGFLWHHHLDWARDIRDNYEENLQSHMKEYSEHPNRPITELEAFVSNILGKTGIQSRHQRELSSTLKEKVDESAAFTVSCIVKNGEEWSEESLERSIACLAISLEEKPRHRRQEQLVSFKYVAASVCLREVARLPEFREDGAGYVFHTT